MSSILSKSRVLALLSVAWLSTTAQTARGPAKGWLVIEGGSNTIPKVVIDRFLTLAGGPHSAIVLIPTAIPDGRSQQPMAEQIALFKTALGGTHITVLHTRDRAVADSEAFTAPLRSAAGVWIMGGQVPLLAAAYVGTRTQRELQALLDRGGVIGGESAGGEMQGAMALAPPNEVRHDPAGPFRNGSAGAPPAVSTKEEHGLYPVVEGFGFLQNVIVIPHVIQRHWESRMAEAEAQHPGMLSVGVDVGCALVVHGGMFDVIGTSKVLIPTHSGNNKGLETLVPGDRFDLVKRVKVRKEL
jgi:cyanophycinase